MLPKWAELSAATRRRGRRQAFWAPVYIGFGLARLQLRIESRELPPVLLQAEYIKAPTSEHSAKRIKEAYAHMWVKALQLRLAQSQPRHTPRIGRMR